MAHLMAYLKSVVSASLGQPLSINHTGGGGLGVCAGECVRLLVWVGAFEDIRWMGFRGCLWAYSGCLLFPISRWSSLFTEFDAPLSRCCMMFQAVSYLMTSCFPPRAQGRSAGLGWRDQEMVFNCVCPC